MFGGGRSNAFDTFDLDEFKKTFEVTTSALSNAIAMNKETSEMMNANIDWTETPEVHIFKADLPGWKKNEVKVKVEEGRVLKIRGERKKESEEKNENYHHVERKSSKFVHRFSLPENAKMKKIKSAMENEVLTITVPKSKH